MVLFGRKISKNYNSQPAANGLVSPRANAAQSVWVAAMRRAKLMQSESIGHEMGAPTALVGQTFDGSARSSFAR